MDANNNNMPQRPLLKKVKRPINRMPQMPPAASTTAAVSEQAGAINNSDNPFVQQSAQRQAQAFQPQRNPQTTDSRQNFERKPFPDVGDEAFNLDAYLDDGQLPTTAAGAVRNDNPRFLQDEDLAPEYEADGDVPNLPPYLTKKILILIGAVLFFLGIITAKVFFSESKVVRNGLQGVVVNPEVPKGRARCGVAERTQGCVLYIMNPQRQELNARDFYDLAAQMTGRQRFVIETGNMRYSNTKIRPGDIVQLNIPPL